MVFSTTSWLLIAAIIATIAGYIILLVKIKTTKQPPRAQQPPDIYNFTESLQEISQTLPDTRRREQLEKIRDERIKQYFLEQKKRKQRPFSSR